VLLSVIGAVQYGTSKVFYKIVPHFDAQELRQYIHQVMAIFSKTGKEVVMVVDRSGIHRAHKLDATLEHYHSKFRLHFLPAHCGHHLNPYRNVPDATYKNDLGSPQALSADDAQPEGWRQKGEQMDVHRFSRHDDLADQALGNSLPLFKRELGQILAQQLAKRLGIVHDVLPMDALLLRVG
jgi:hypothetical protein